jgi:hypothetical protein
MFFFCDREGEIWRTLTGCKQVKVVDTSQGPIGNDAVTSSPWSMRQVNPSPATGPFSVAGPTQYAQVTVGDPNANMNCAYTIEPGHHHQSSYGGQVHD